VKNNGKKIPTGGELISTFLKGSTHVGRSPGLAKAVPWRGGQMTEDGRQKNYHERSKVRKTRNKINSWDPGKLGGGDQPPTPRLRRAKEPQRSEPQRSMPNVKFQMPSEFTNPNVKA